MYYKNNTIMINLGYVKCISQTIFVDGTQHNVGDILNVNAENSAYFNNEQNSEKYLQVYKYYMFDFHGNNEMFIGYFENDDSFWNYYWKNESEIVEKQIKKIGRKSSWFMSSF